ncbi:MAG: DUF2062 domain-containing protein [Vicinamibacterales bacterium]
MPRRRGWLARRVFQSLRREYSSANRDAVAIGFGAFIGCLPIYGFHLLLTILVGRVLRLNRLKMYLAANISNPLMAPFLIFAEIQTGAWLYRGAFHALTIDAMRTLDPWALGGDLLLGSVVIGLAIGALLAVSTRAASKAAPSLPPAIVDVLTSAADRYVDTTIVAWEFARGKLRGDGVYGALLAQSLPPGEACVDIGCGQGLTLAAMIEAQRLHQTGEWPLAPPPQFARLVGIEMRGRVAAIARAAIGGEAEIVQDRAPAGLPDRFSAALLIDVLHMMPAGEQEALLEAVGSRMPDGGVLLVREADADAVTGFGRVRFGNRLKAILFGNWTQVFHFRGAREWEEVFRRLGWTVTVVATESTGGFANVLFRLTWRPPRSFPSTDRTRTTGEA